METFDVIGAVGLTLSAAILAATLSVVIGGSAARRLTVGSFLAGWFVFVLILGGTHVLDPERGIGVRGLGIAVAVPILAMWIALLRLPSLRKGLAAAPLAVLVGLHVVRVLGIDFLLLQAAHRLPAPFALEAGWGDIIAGLAAIPVAWMVHRRAWGWRPALIAWNLFGLTDLVAALGLGVLSSPGPLHLILADPPNRLMTVLPWLLIPAFVVPLLVVMHLMIFFRLAGQEQEVVGRQLSAAPN